MNRFASEAHLAKQRARARKRREQRGVAPVVHYFHQVDDPYSHLAVQKLDDLNARYTLDFKPHLTSRADESYRGSAEHFDAWAVRDAASAAAGYGTTFSPSVESPGTDRVAQANEILAGQLDAADFAATAISVGNALWGDGSLYTLAASGAGVSAVAEGNRMRNTLGHYAGAMFYFDGEWFWGVDRLRLLETRLAEEGFSTHPDNLCVPEPQPTDTTGLNAAEVLLEYFPSLRSPYTAIGHQRVLDLIARSGVSVKVRPVMPMLMRGIPAPRAKQQYIISDSGREGRAHGVPFGGIVDPFGEPVKRAFALFPAAAAMGREMEFVTAYLQAAWFEGVDITRASGLQHVAANAGLDWEALQAARQNTDWEAVLKDNLDTMLAEHLWGVPSFRVSGGNKPGTYACWGQDRIWRVENEIASRAED